MASHKEMIKAHKFGEKFKNSLRDYFNYGFKNMCDFTCDKEKQKSRKTILDDWNRLNNILIDYVDWSEKKRINEIMYATKDSQDLGINPFHRVYKFCIYPDSYPLYFFHTMAALSSLISLNSEIETIGRNEEERKRLERILIEDKSRTLNIEIGHLHLSLEQRDDLGRLYEEQQLFLEYLKDLSLDDEQIRVFEDVFSSSPTLKTSDIIAFLLEGIISKNEKD